MALKSINPTTTKAWKALQSHFKTIKEVHMTKWFAQDTERVNQMTIKCDDFYVDYSKNRITPETKKLLLQMATEVDLKDAMSKYFSGDAINETENRAVAHVALRDPKYADFYINGENVMPDILQVKKQIKEFTDSVVSGDRKGFTNKKFTDIVNIGIGGSDLGPSMVVEALQFYKNHLTTHFVSNVDGDHVNEVLKKLNPETTLFVIVSKTFTTQETLSNATTIREWFLKHGSQEDVSKHFVAVSTNIQKVKEFGIAENNIFPMWDWVGGRFSLWSAVGLSISLSIGYEHFEALLLGAHKMDKHFKNEEFDQNIPVILALLSVWYTNFFDEESEAVIPYSQYLNQFTTYLQQAIMESNGKSIDRTGNKVTYQTGSVIWGEPGTNSQHAFFQLIHQGTKMIPATFIGFGKSLYGNKEHHDKLMSNFIAQTEALLKGKSETDVLLELQKQNLSKEEIQRLLPFKKFEGNKPTTTILINQLTPESLGKLIALFEHKIFVEGVIWNIYSYDQFGVELGKQLANTILMEFDSIDQITDHDASTKNILEYYKNLTL